MTCRRLPAVLLLAAFTLAPSPASARRPWDCDRTEGERLYTCYGYTRGGPLIVRALEQEGVRSRQARDLVRLAARLGLRDAIPALRRMLVDPAANDSVRMEVAVALGELGDRDSAEAIHALARRYEHQHWTGWRESVRALRLLGKDVALDYARDLMARMPAPEGGEGETEIDLILPILIDNEHGDALPVLRRWTEDRSHMRDMYYARVMGARLRLGDEPLLRDMRRALGTRNAVVPVDPHYWIAGLGSHPDDVPALVRFAGSTGADARAAYDGIDRLIGVLDRQIREGGARARAARAARRRLLDGLVALTPYREDRNNVQFEARYLARHHASLARLGHEPSRRRLLELTGEDPYTVIPWVAALHALRLGLPGAADRAAEVMARGKLPMRGRDYTYNDRVALLDEAAGQLGGQDARWTVALLDNHGIVRDRALHHMSRIQPVGACEVITAQVSDAPEDGVHDGLLALTVLGRRCEAALSRLADASPSPAPVRGTTLEVLTMMGSARSRELMDRWRFFRYVRAYVLRAEQIAALP